MYVCMYMCVCMCVCLLLLLFGLCLKLCARYQGTDCNSKEITEEWRQFCNEEIQHVYS